jgi:hypothetical protein
VIDDILHWQPDANHADLTLYVAALFAGALDPRE